MRALGEHRLLSGDQLRRLTFSASPSKVRRRLRSLYDHGLIERMPVLSGPAEGIPPFVYTLTRRGASLLHDPEISARTRHGNGAAVRSIHHRFLVNEFYVALMEASHARDCHVRGWRSEEQLKLAGPGTGLARAETVAHPRLSRPLPFLPDGFFELDAGRGRSFAYFVEIDRATHPHRVWQQRAHLYAAYADPRTGLFRRRFGRDTFRLAILTTPDHRQRSRRANVLETIRRTIGPTDMFLAATFADVAAGRILDRVWRTADGTDRLCSLAENARVVVRPTNDRDRRGGA
jgi:DNA-binding HxlR family transcriptional regulator